MINLYVPGGIYELFFVSSMSIAGYFELQEMVYQKA